MFRNVVSKDINKEVEKHIKTYKETSHRHGIQLSKLTIVTAFDPSLSIRVNLRAHQLLLKIIRLNKVLATEIAISSTNGPIIGILLTETALECLQVFRQEFKDISEISDSNWLNLLTHECKLTHEDVLDSIAIKEQKTLDK